jgi:hypothetical protein
MKRYNAIYTTSINVKKTALSITALLWVAILLAACAPSLTQSSPTPQPALEPTPTGIDSQMKAPVTAAKSALAQQLELGIDAIQLVDIQPVQWPDSCLGVHQPGIMCAMHVVDGYRIMLSANNRTYEIRSNLDGSQTVLASGSTPEQ